MGGLSLDTHREGGSPSRAANQSEQEREEDLVKRGRGLEGGRLSELVASSENTIT